MKEQHKQTITRTELVNLLRGVETPQFVSMVTLTDVDMNKYKDFKKEGKTNPNPYFGQVKNLSRKYKIITGFDYERSVNNRLEREGKETNFEGQGNWFDVISKGLVQNKKDLSKYYFRYQYQKDSTTEQEYLFNGNPIEKQLFESYMKQKGNYENQGLDNPLMFQVVSVDNVLELTMNGTRYTIEG